MKHTLVYNVLDVIQTLDAPPPATDALAKR